VKKEIVQVDEVRGIARITTLDERWYSREVRDPKTGLPVIEYRPSITYKAHFYPKGKGFEQYLKRNGEDADVIVALAAERGSKVHQAIEVLNRGGEVKLSDKFLNTRTGQEEELTPDEYWCVMTYLRWWETEGRNQYEILEAEDIIWPEGPGSEYGGPLHFAATRDIRLRRKSDGTTGTVDVKTSKDIYASHIIQVSAIAEASGDAWQAILQVGYTRTQKGYKFTEVERRMDLVAASNTIWMYETEGEKPLQRDFPLSLSLNLPKDEPGPEERAIAEAEAADEPELARTIKRKTRTKDLEEDTAIEQAA
jgi:hypothetical protein